MLDRRAPQPIALATLAGAGPVHCVLAISFVFAAVARARRPCGTDREPAMRGRAQPGAANLACCLKQRYSPYLLSVGLAAPLWLKKFGNWRGSIPKRR